MPKMWVAAIFEKFQARYSHKWTSGIEGIEDTAITEWSNELNGLTGEQVKTGLEAWKGDWPPSAPEFRKACLGTVTNDLGLDYTPPYHREFAPDRLLESDDVKDRRKKLANEFFNKFGARG